MSECAACSKGLRPPIRSIQEMDWIYTEDVERIVGEHHKRIAELEAALRAWVEWEKGERPLHDLEEYLHRAEALLAKEEEP